MLMKIFLAKGWKSRTGRVILTALFHVFAFMNGAVCHAEPAVKVGEALPQVRPLAEVAPTEEIRRDLEETRKELQNLRRRHAELYLRCKEQQAAIRSYETKLAAVLSPNEDLSSAAVREKLLERLKQEDLLRAQLQVELEEFSRHLAIVLDALKPADTVRANLDQRLELLKQNAARQLSIEVARRGSDPSTSQCRVLEISPELNLVVIDGGSSKGLKPGLTFSVFSADKRLAMVQVIEVRPALSAAVIISGRAKDLRPGMELKLGE
jgi:plasmid maintenance system killer protein